MTWDYFESEEQKGKKNGDKWPELQACGVLHQAYQYVHGGSPRRRRGKREERIFEEIMAEHLPNLMKNISLQIQEAQWIPNRTNSNISIPNTIKQSKDNLDCS